MNNEIYKIDSANPMQRSYILERVPIKDERERAQAKIFVASDDERNMVGRIVLREQKIPFLDEGKLWFIDNIFVHPSHRRRGIATALLAHSFSEAEKIGVFSFQGSANATREAQGFWSANGFAFLKFGPPHKDPKKPKELGNHTHFIFRRVERAYERSFSDLRDCPTAMPIIIADAEKKQRDAFFDDAMKKTVFPYVITKKEESQALVAKNEWGDVMGFLTFYDEEMVSPLQGKNRFMAYVYTKEEFRHQGVAARLIHTFLRRAKADGVAQIIGVYPNDAAIPLFVHLGFDIFVTRYLMSFPTETYSFGIGKRIGEGSLVL